MARVDIWDYDPDRKDHAYIWCGSVQLNETKLIQEDNVVVCYLGPN